MTRWEDDTAKAGRFLVRALVVAGGAAAACALAWLTATASASTVTEVTDGPLGAGVPAVAATIGDAEPPVLGHVPMARDTAAPAVARVRALPGAATDPARLTDLVKTDAVSATVAAVGRFAAAATELTGLDTPAAGSPDHAGHAPAGLLDSAGPDDVSRAPHSVPRKRSAGLFPATTPVRVIAHAVAGRLPAGHRADRGAEDSGGRSWLPSGTVSANAGPASGYDRGCGDVAQPFAAERPQSPPCRNDVSRSAVTAAEIQPGVTPD
ncbi:hypothetical protein DV20_35345 [Amycolatopsis rifamycinica]|uniref:Uncharacterized protein n=1 Tax=Amycolatopsis rifamycinica TaxID=287986 RepID=A0A066U0G6_9PSEU|nr:hypothetical protein DV20_35345 [Amycolatopsis rifamycinica]